MGLGLGGGFGIYFAQGALKVSVPNAGDLEQPHVSSFKGDIGVYKVYVGVCIYREPST